MAVQWTASVISDMATEIGWDSEGFMIVTWKNGRRSAYEGVDEATAISVSKAPSVGQMLNMDIKPNYTHRYL